MENEVCLQLAEEASAISSTVDGTIVMVVGEDNGGTTEPELLPIDSDTVDGLNFVLESTMYALSSR